MNSSKLTLVRVAQISGAALLALAGLAVAGPLNPAAGPVTSTYKTLGEVEPRIAISATNTPGSGTAVFKITQPGSYYLTESVTGVAGRNGIEIAASDVTIDLNGFALTGVPGSLNGVAVSVSGLKGATVKNGAVRLWGQIGVDLLSNGPTSSQISDVRSCDNGSVGLRVREAGQIMRCTASGNGSRGISCQSACTIIDCTCSGNLADGFVVGTGGIVSGCTAYNNGACGFNASDASTLKGCSAYGNAAEGILGSGACSIATCVASHNTENGIQAYSGSRIVDCSASGNGLDGIQCTSGCVVTGNACNGNGTGAAGGAGVHATGADNRIEGNNCAAATRGIVVDLAGNFLVRNTCSGNTLNWVLAANNVFGPILDRSAPASGAVSGNAATGSLGSTDGNANFTY